MEFNSVQLFPCSHSKNSLESQFLESQKLFSSLKLYYIGQPQKAYFII